MKRVSGWRSISAMLLSRLSEMQVERQVVRHGGAADAVEAGVAGRPAGLFRQHDADADRARHLLPGDDIGHRGSSALSGLMMAIRLEAAPLPWRSSSNRYSENAEMKMAPSTPTLSIAATISSPVTCGASSARWPTAASAHWLRRHGLESMIMGAFPVFTQLVTQRFMTDSSPLCVNLPSLMV
jgi:hypothetical protein